MPRIEIRPADQVPPPDDKWSELRQVLKDLRRDQAIFITSDSGQTLRGLSGSVARVAKTAGFKTRSDAIGGGVWIFREFPKPEENTPRPLAGHSAAEARNALAATAN